MPRVGTATTSGTNGSSSGSSRVSARPTASRAARSARWMWSTGNPLDVEASFAEDVGGNDPTGDWHNSHRWYGRRGERAADGASAVTRTRPPSPALRFDCVGTCELTGAD